MSAPLWTLDEVVAVTGADINFSSPVPGEEKEDITGISIDTRTIQAGNLFVALKDVRDGHEFVSAAFKAGAAAALVKRDYKRVDGDGVLLRVDDPLEALVALGRAARARLSPQARVIAVTGSAGKTTTKEMLRACLTPLGATHASEKSYNNHWGVPLTLARMPRDTQFGVFEIGMNHAGEITPLTRMVRPHVAIITTVAAVHLEHFPGGVADIAKAKAEIFSGLEPGGTAVIPRDNAHADLLTDAAERQKTKVVHFGGGEGSDARLIRAGFDGETGTVLAQINSRLITYRLGAPGLHMIQNSLAVVAAVDAVDLDPTTAIAPLADMGAPQGRGSRTRITAMGGDALLIDESYNANPASVRAALESMSIAWHEDKPRRIAVLGDMLELGLDAPRLHAELADAIASAKVDLVFACGPLMKHLFEALPAAQQGKWALTAVELEGVLLETVRGGDVVMIKGSNGMRMARLVAALIARHNAAQTSE